MSSNFVFDSSSCSLFPLAPRFLHLLPPVSLLLTPVPYSFYVFSSSLVLTPCSFTFPPSSYSCSLFLFLMLTSYSCSLFQLPNPVTSSPLLFQLPAPTPCPCFLLLLPLRTPTPYSRSLFLLPTPAPYCRFLLLLPVPQRREQEIVAKCKRLRERLGRGGGRQKKPQASFSMALQQVKGSRLYRRLAREAIDGKLPGPPSYFTQRKDGYSLPALNKYIHRYVNLIKGNLSSKTLEINFNIMNRVAWTNEKQYKSRAYGGGTGNCSLCGSVESTQHLIFDCEEYAEIFWDVLIKAITKGRGQESQESTCVYMYNVMYNIHTEGVL